LIGLGSSSTVIVGLINTLSKIIDRNYSSLEVAKLAYHIEREVLCFAGGVQDQYIAAIGGIQILDVKQTGEVICTPLMIDEKNRFKLQKHLVLIYTGQERLSSKIIKSQKRDLKRMFEVYDEIKEIGRASVDLLVNADIEGLGNLMDRHWAIKRTLSKKMSTNTFDKLYIRLKELGSSGGKKPPPPAPIILPPEDPNSFNLIYSLSKVFVLIFFDNVLLIAQCLSIKLPKPSISALRSKSTDALDEEGELRKE
jgi:D-glycero-alpha-D-manno-heptose-7-phosphate kinase